MRLETLRTQLSELAARQADIKAELRSIVESDEAATPDDEARTKGLLAEHTDIEPKIAQIRGEIEAIEKVLTAPETAVERGGLTAFVRKSSPLDDETVTYGPAAQVRGAARTAIEQIPMTDDHTRSELYKTLDRTVDQDGKLARHMIAASRPAYRSAFAKLINGEGHLLTADEQRAVQHVRTASLTDANGGYAVPTVLDPTLILTGAHDGLVPNPVRQLANVRQITGDNLNVVSTAGVTAAFVAEATEATDGSPTLSNLTLTPNKAHVMIPFTYEIGMDWPGMEAEMRRLIAVSKDDLEANKFLLGTGSNQPLGLIYDIYTNYSGQVQASATTDTFAVADVYATVAKVADRFRGRGSWLANELIFDKVRQFDTNGGADMWVMLAADRPATLLGRPAYSQAQMDGTITTSADNYVLAFGDIREAYTIVDRVGLTVEVIPHLFGTSNNLPNGTRGLYAYWRTGGRVVNSGAVGVLNVT